MTAYKRELDGVVATDTGCKHARYERAADFAYRNGIAATNFAYDCGPGQRFAVISKASPSITRHNDRMIALFTLPGDGGSMGRGASFGLGLDVLAYRHTGGVFAFVFPLTHVMREMQGAYLFEPVDA